MHKSYEEKLGHRADFRVKYKFYTEQEGGRKTLPYQGIRSDFWYPNENHKPNEMFMIWPEFEDKNGNLVLDNDRKLAKEGNAKMWIIIPERRDYHKGKIKIGTKGYFREGNVNTAECEVIEIVGLNENPTKSK